MATVETDKETQPSLRLLQSPGQSTENPEEVETTQLQQKRSPVWRPYPPQAQESPVEAIAQLLKLLEMTVSPPGQGPIQDSVSYSDTVQPLVTEFTISSKPIIAGKHSVALQEAVIMPQKHPEAPLIQPDLVQHWYPNLTPVMAHPLHLDHSMASLTTSEDTLYSVIPETPSQSQEPSLEAIVQHILSLGMTSPTPALDQAQYPTSLVQPLDMSFTISSGLSTEAEHSVALQKPEAPSPKHPEVTLAYSDQVQAWSPSLIPATLQSLDGENTINQYSVNYPPEKALTVPKEQDTTRATNTCELCACRNETLSCVGLSPMQKLHQVPVLEPNMNNTFTVL